MNNCPVAGVISELCVSRLRSSIVSPAISPKCATLSEFKGCDCCAIPWMMAEGEETRPVPTAACVGHRTVASPSQEPTETRSALASADRAESALCPLLAFPADLLRVHWEMCKFPWMGGVGSCWSLGEPQRGLPLSEDNPRPNVTERLASMEAI